ncbi:heavy metal translocating P-type ATPase [Poseidonocella sedimentorum]|uniref:Cu2+-exporting ATPase n=1 Tax=Poseidonocella sedimentorum TaxID=871652 RepID=A0A1I6DUZ2_9RHOB|nr:heavy metal translocating P-type ATPase [Poseidonocella sedimentorum]SFR09273.1 Cu2+-exporting ATPase [Poseidonocella sedimentorum]
MSMACPACTAAPIAAQRARDGVADMALSLPSIHCAGCIRGVEESLGALPGVRFARVNLSLKRVSVGTSLPEDRIIAALAEAGFEAHALSSEMLEGGGDATGRDLLWRMGLSGFAMMNVMLLSVAVWSGATDATRDFFHLISALVATPVVVYAGQPFFASATGALRARRLNMDVPISLAILLATVMSLYETLHSGAHAYFDAALSLTFFLLIGRYLDHRTRAAARSAARELSALEQFRADRLDDAGRAIPTPIADLAVGDRLLIATGMRLPVDGELLSQSAQLDRAFLTGESETVTAAAGARLHAGEVNLGAPLTLRATAVGEDTTLRRIAAMVETAENARNSYTDLADRAAAIYAPAVHLLALAAFLGWALWDGDIRHALNVAIAVLIITCPCALGLAVPAVSTAAISRLYGRGYLVKSGSALERLADADTVVFDKTGTLTLPGVAVEGIAPEDRPILLGLAQASSHPLARALREALAEERPAALDQIHEVAGQGIEGQYRGQEVRLGNDSWIGARVGGFGYRIGARNAPLAKRERLRPGAEEAVAGLRATGKRIVMLSGDRQQAAEGIARALGIEEVIAGVVPEEKHRVLERLAAEGCRVLMVGDGLNDTPSLAAAHVSLAPSSAIDAARTAADIVLTREDIGALPMVLQTAERARRLSMQNFGIALGYNAIAVPVALVGLATPLIAALAMSASSLTVLANAMRVRKVRS